MTSRCNTLFCFCIETKNALGLKQGFPNASALIIAYRPIIMLLSTWVGMLSVSTRSIINATTIVISGIRCRKLPTAVYVTITCRSMNGIIRR